MRCVGGTAVQLPLRSVGELFQLSRIGEGELSGRKSQSIAVPTLLEFLGIELALQIFQPGLALVAHDMVPKH